jgi:ribonuclease Z
MSIELTILGSSSATPTLHRFPTSQHLQMLDHHILIDCGEGAQMQLRRYKLKRSKIKHIFISHLHADHILGLPGLIFSMNLVDRKDPLHIYAPKELFDFIDLTIRLSDTTLRFEIIKHFTQAQEPEILLENSLLKVTSFPLYHRVPTTGLLFEENEKLKGINVDACNKYLIPFTHFNDLKRGKDFIGTDGKIIFNEMVTHPASPKLKYAFCSDTMYDDRVASAVAGVDLLYHETTFMHDKLARAIETMHTTAMQAGEIAKKAQVKKLIIGHFSSRYDNLQPLLDEAKAVFENTELATEGKKFVVEENALFAELS